VVIKHTNSDREARYITSTVVGPEAQGAAFPAPSCHCFPMTMTVTFNVKLIVQNKRVDGFCKQYSTVVCGRNDLPVPSSVLDVKSGIKYLSKYHSRTRNKDGLGIEDWRQDTVGGF